MDELRGVSLILLLYLIVGTAVVYFSFNKNIVSKGINYFLTILLSFPLLLVVSFRPLDAGNDTARYVKAFEQLDGVTSAYFVGVSNFGNTEFGFWPFVSILKLFGFTANGFIFFSGLLSFLLLSYLIKLYLSEIDSPSVKEKNNVLLWTPAITLFAISTYLVVYMGNHIRASIAIPISFIMMYRFFIEKKRVQGGVLGVLAVSIHFSVIMAFFAKYPLAINKKIFWFIIVFFSFLLSEIAPLIAGELIQYLPFLEKKYDLYFNFKHVAEFDSIYGLTNFRILAIILIINLVFFKGGSAQKLYSYFFCCIVLFSSVPQVSERYFPFAFLIAPLAVYESFWFLEGKSKMLLMFLCFYLLFAVTITSSSAMYTLGLN